METNAPTVGPSAMTVDELAAAAGTTTRHVRSLQTLGLLPRPELRGRTGLYGPVHHDRLVAVLRLQERGFSLESLRSLFDAHAAGHSLASVLGLPETPGHEDCAAADRRVLGADEAGRAHAPEDTAALYGFAELQPAVGGDRRGEERPLLSVVPTTVWEDSRAS